MKHNTWKQILSLFSITHSNVISMDFSQIFQLCFSLTMPKNLNKNNSLHVAVYVMPKIHIRMKTKQMI